MPHYEILQNDDAALVVKVNPAAYKAEVFSGTPPKDATLVVNANYYWKPLAIGLLASDGKWKFTNSSYKALRPTLYLFKKGPPLITFGNHLEDASGCQAIIQAGPTLLRSGKYVYAVKEENFKDDAVRRANHTVIGLTVAHKLIVAFAANASIKELSDLMDKHKCIDAFKLDGGNSCYLRIQLDNKTVISRGPNTRPFVGLALL